MNPKIRSIVTIIKNIWNKIFPENPNLLKDHEIPYTALSPTGSADIDNDYKKALDWALAGKKENDIRNIALTGPYGSGKSSILKTYINTSKSKNLHFLPISLATFKEEKSRDKTAEAEDILRLIELSILQQIFYHEKDNKIPDSRFKKIKSYSRRSLFLSTLAILAVIISILSLEFNSFWSYLLAVNIDQTSHRIIHYIAVGVITVGTFLLVFRSIRTFTAVRIDKLNIHNAEIKVDESISKSVFNQHLDEILYFFEVTKYNVLIIEDLDRFQETEIFTKLREINLLINNSKKINKEVVFIYAVRDDMFTGNRERTKFFDFIIPVIPIINASNSSQKLLEKTKTHEFNISEDLIEDISFFIDDMRLLYGITNEYFLYREKMNKTLNQDKLLSILVYKNIFPYDFTLLTDNKGVLYNALSQKQVYIRAEIAKINERIAAYKNEIKLLEQLQITKIKELRALYILQFINHATNFLAFSKNNTQKDSLEMTEDDSFPYLVDDQKSKYFSLRPQYHNVNYQEITKFSVKFAAIEKEVDPKYSYREREIQITDWNANKIDILKTDIAQLEKEKQQARNTKIKELLSKGHISLEIEHPVQKNLVTLLLRNGFIDEDYLDYVTIFYEGTLTKTDHQFLMNVKSQIPTPYEYRLNRTDKLIDKINPRDFSDPYILNYNLTDFMLSSPQYAPILDNMFTQLTNENDNSIQYIDGFIENGVGISAFVKGLTNRWVGIWSYVKEKSNYTEEKTKLYFKLIIEHTGIEDLKKMYQLPAFRKSITECPDFFEISNDSEKLLLIIKTLNLRFSALQNIPAKYRDFFANHSYYALNPEMIKLTLSLKDKFNQVDFDTKNYFAITNPALESLTLYANSNINEYLENVYFKIEANIHEDEFELLSLLNNNDITLQNKEQILGQVETKITELDNIPEDDIKTLVMKLSKVTANWENVIHYYQTTANEEINSSIIEFLEFPGNAAILASESIKTDSEGEDKYWNFITTLILTNEINNETYDLIAKSVPYHFDDLDIASLSQPKVNSLIEHDILEFNSGHFQKIKKFRNLHIRFLIANTDAFLDNLKDYPLDKDDILTLLWTNDFTLTDKNRLTDGLDENVLTGDNQIIEALVNLVFANNSYHLSDNVLKKILINNTLARERRMKMFNWKHQQLQNDYVDVFLNALNDPYENLTIPGKRPLIDNNDVNQTLVEILQFKGYISSFDIEKSGIRVATFKNK